ncbi:MAG: tetratricopeptide repeat protein, partial [Armatimonadota bacterium]
RGRGAADAAPVESRAGAFRLSACALLTACALFSKENAVVLPVLALGYAWILGCRMSRAEKIKWAAAFIVPMAVFVLVRRHAVHVTVVTHPEIVLGRRILGIGIAYAAYLRMLLVPQVGRVVYDVFPIGMKYPLIALAAWLVPTGLVALTLRLRRSVPVAAFGTMWVFITLLPVSNILPAASPIPAERFVYLPGAGSAIVLGWLAKVMLDWRPRSVRVWPAVAVAIVVWYLLLCTALTIQSTPQYSSSLAWARAIAAANGRFYRSWSGYYFLQAGLFKEAAEEYRAAIERSPRPEADDFIGLSKALRALNRWEEAIRTLLEARARFGPDPKIELNLGNACAEAGRLKDAQAAFERAVRLDPGSAAAWVGLGRVRFVLHDYAGAVTAYTFAESIAELLPVDRLRFGLACKRTGLLERALEQFRRAAEQDPRGKIGKLAGEEIGRIRH